MKNIQRPAEMKGKLVERGATVMIWTHDIPQYFQEPYPFLLNFWTIWKVLGSPWSVGWHEWPAWAVDTIMAIKEIE